MQQASRVERAVWQQFHLHELRLVLLAKAQLGGNPLQTSLDRPVIPTCLTTRPVRPERANGWLLRTNLSDNSTGSPERAMRGQLESV